MHGARDRKKGGVAKARMSLAELQPWPISTMYKCRFSSVGVSWALAIEHSAPDPGSNPG